MRKIIFYLLIIACIAAKPLFFSWSGLASNQTVSFANALDAVNNGFFASKTTIASSSKLMTKAEANTYLYINTSYAPYAAKSSGQLVVKSDLQSIGEAPVDGTYRHMFYCSGGSTCSSCNTPSGNYLYSYASAGDNPAEGIVLYQFKSGSTLSNPVTANFTASEQCMMWRNAIKLWFHTDASSGMTNIHICP